MLDGVMRRIVSPPLDVAGAALAARGVTANQVTLAGLAAALAMVVAIAGGHLLLALACLMLSRIADGLDGAVARHAGLSDLGGMLDIVCDFAFYAALPLGFALADGRDAVPATVLLASFYLNAASFLGFAALAAKRGMETTIRGPKSLYFTTGLAEGTETIAAFVAMLVWPGWFAALAYGFAALCLVTCIARVLLARKVFATGAAGHKPD